MWSDVDAATWELKHSGTPNTDCQPSFTSVAGKVKHGMFSADECKTSLTENADGITLDYEFKIQVSASGSPTFPYDHEYTITCTYIREKQGLQASFLTQHSVTETGTGNQFHKSSPENPLRSEEKMKQPPCLPFIVVLLAFYSAPSYEQETTTIENIICGDVSNIEFTLVIPDINQWDDGNKAMWELKHSGSSNTDCQPSFTSVAGKVKYGAFSADVCMNSLTENADGITLDYEFKIEVSASGSPTFQYDHDYTITCTYNREKQGLQASFLPQHSITETGTDSGELAFTFELLDGSTPVVPSTEITLGTDLIGKLTVSESGFPTNKFNVFFVSVKADKETPDTSITLITNGCAENDQTSFVDDSSCDGDNEEEFSFKAFRFSGQTGSQKVVFTVTAKVCYDGSSGCECGCGSLKRRSTLDETSKTLYYIRAGPFTFVDADEGEEQADTVVDEDKDSSVPNHVVTVGVVGGVVAVAIVCVAVIIVLRKRRHNVTLTESSGAQEFATPGV